ncbi:type II toxin-antitoxin system RelE/ParE family toxin [Roseateles depolymerans]|uniref:type II toxin-antitoxin system RelE/ParE family toxin n=1 Tax=Roseateles depolymerans TaxID=76731 RepID=UPI00073D93FF|nr:type II toxin-antitoxin system RelE/ParE family toxin [Roseateles depolymerans]REG15311.1 toxin ParE1/3/4 [Roseateles depolymerans]
MRYLLHPAAEKDLSDAFSFYLEKAGRSVALRFLDEFERALGVLERHPRLGTPTRGRRVYPMRIFPYAIIYKEGEPGLLVLVVRHQRRRPNVLGSSR